MQLREYAPTLEWLHLVPTTLLFKVSAVDTVTIESGGTEQVVLEISVSLPGKLNIIGLEYSIKVGG